MAWVWEIKHGARPQAAGKLAPGWHKKAWRAAPVLATVLRCGSIAVSVKSR
jgi:hypothetical protein